MNQDKVSAKVVKVAACQVPDLREDLDGAISRINSFSRKAIAQGISLLCFPECFLQGYLVEESVAKFHALDLSSEEFKDVLEQLPAAGPMLVIGMIEIERGRLFNTAIVVQHQKLVGYYRKNHLLEGESIFTAGYSHPVFEIEGLKFGINICYDTNFPALAAAISIQGARLIVCPANNMMHRQKSEALKHLHNEVRSKRSKETGLWFISSDVTGKRDGKVSYGPTAVIDPNGRIVTQVPLLEIGMVSVDIPL